MKYLLLICTDPAAEPYNAQHDNIGEWVSEYDGRGWRTFGDRLRPAADTTTVTVRGDQTLVTPGTTGETRESIAGLDLIDCPTLQDALDCAAKHPMARFGKVEVRPFWPFV